MRLVEVDLSCHLDRRHPNPCNPWTPAFLGRLFPAKQSRWFADSLPERGVQSRTLRRRLARNPYSLLAFRETRGIFVTTTFADFLQSSNPCADCLGFLIRWGHETNLKVCTLVVLCPSLARQPSSSGFLAMREIMASRSGPIRYDT